MTMRANRDASGIKNKNLLHVMLGACVCLAFFGLGQFSCMNQSLYNNYNNDHDHATQPSQVIHNDNDNPNYRVYSSMAEDIVMTSFDQTYALLLDSCSDDDWLQNCIQNILDDKISDEVTSTTNIPWWFRTMLRDSLGRYGVFGRWHALMTMEPPMQMCTIEKVGTKHWRRTFCHLNRMMHHPALKYNGVCWPNFTSVPDTAPRFVFLRDPLERFLSGFLDKCLRTRRTDIHCEPLQVFQNDQNGMTRDLLWNPRTFFEAYVDAIPLKWNMHFFPLSLYCDGLYRHLSDYDFVGHMGPDFYQDVYALGQQLGPRMMDTLETVFHLEKRQEDEEKNVGVEGQAALNVEEYYTAKTVKRVLEYVSIDYVMLNLTIPEWAERMLEEDAEVQTQETASIDE